MKASKGSKNEVLVATLSDDDSTDSNKNLYIMALDDEVGSTSSSITYDELS